jgi:hypothetical protein
MYRGELLYNIFVLFVLERDRVVVDELVRHMGNGEVVLGGMSSDVGVVEGQLGLILDAALSVQEGHQQAFLGIHFHSYFVELYLSSVPGGY